MTIDNERSADVMYTTEESCNLFQNKMLNKNAILDEQITCHEDFRSQVVHCHDKLLAMRTNVDEFCKKIREFITVVKEIPLKKIEKGSRFEIINEIGQSHQVSTNKSVNLTVFLKFNSLY